VSSDGHVVHGAIAFAVGDVSGPPPSASPAGADPGGLVLPVVRGIADLGLLVTVGAVAAWLVLGATSLRVRRLAIVAAVVGAVAGIGVAVLTWAEAGQAALAGSTFPAVVLRAGLLLGIALTIRAGAWRVAVLLGVVALATVAVSGHPGASVGTAGLLVIHLAAAGVWLGAAPAVLLVLLDRELLDGDAVRVVRRFSRLSTVTLFVVIGAGSALAFLIADGSLDAVDPRYLGFLAAKVAVVLLAAVLGATTRRRLARDSATRSDLGRVFAVDAALLVVVVTLTMGLTVGPPRTDVGEDEDVHVGHCPLDTPGGTGSLSLVPARVGDNTVYLDGAGDLDSALVELRILGDPGAIEVELEPNGTGWRGQGSVPVAGTWDATVRMRVDAFSEAPASCQLRVQP
jgi:putative copper export protein